VFPPTEFAYNEIRPLSLIVEPRVVPWSTRRARRSRDVFRLMDQSAWELMYFSNTLGNATRAACTRVLHTVPSPVGTEVNRCYQHNVKTFRRLGGRLPTQPLTDEQLVVEIEKIKVATKRRRYMAAFEDLKRTPFDPEKDSRVKCFVKLEVVQCISGKMIKPRMIQYRTDRFLVHFMRYYRPLEHALYKCNYMTSGSEPDVAKALNGRTRATVLVEKTRKFLRPIALSLDGKAFDAHVHLLLLKMEHRLYMAAFKAAGWTSGELAEVRKILKCQERNVVSGRFDDGHISYVVPGRRMSGDLNTSGGNITIMTSLAKYILDTTLGENHYTFLDDGDDIVVIVDGARFNPGMMTTITNMFLRLGMEITVDGNVDASIPENIVFCQSRPVELVDGWTMVRDPGKVFATTSTSPTWFRTSALVKEYYATIGVGDGILHRGVPLLQSLAQFQRKFGDGFSAHLWDKTWRFNNIDSDERYDPIEIPHSVRESFAKAFNISPLEQVFAEAVVESRQPSFVIEGTNN